MRWNWDFLRNQKTDLPKGSFRPTAEVPTAARMITINGHARPMDGTDLSDMDVAGRVRMLMRGQLDHPAVCELARDRIVYLADRLGEIEALTADQIGRAIYAKQCELIGPTLEAIGTTPLSWDESPDDSRELYVALGTAVLALLAAPPTPADTRVWHDRTTLASKFEEQRTRDGYHRHRLKGTEVWTESRPERATGGRHEA